MRAGLLTHVITIERETETVTATGHVKKAWTPIATVRAQVKTASVDEYLSGFGEADAGNVVFVIRYPRNVDSVFTADTVIGADTVFGDGQITTADRIVHNGKVFNIRAIVEIGRKRGLELTPRPAPP